MRRFWIEFLTLMGFLSSWFATPAYAKQILVPNTGSTQPGITPGQGSQLGQLPSGDIASQPHILKTPLPGTDDPKSKPAQNDPCLEDSPPASLSSRKPQAGIDLAQNCTPPLLPAPSTGQAGQAGSDRTQPSEPTPRD